MIYHRIPKKINSSNFSKQFKCYKPPFVSLQMCKMWAKSSLVLLKLQNLTPLYLGEYVIIRAL